MKCPESENKICLDANVLVSYYCEDENRPEAATLMDHLTSRQYFIMCPALINFEITNALSRKERCKIINQDHSSEIVRHLFELPIVLVWQNEYLQESLKIQREALPSIFDAAYVATAKKNDIPLITEDLELLKKGRRVYPAIFTVKQWLKMAEWGQDWT